MNILLSTLRVSQVLMLVVVISVLVGEFLSEFGSILRFTVKQTWVITYFVRLMLFFLLRFRGVAEKRDFWKQLILFMLLFYIGSSTV